jgi:hypothetical protein
MRRQRVESTHTSTANGPHAKIVIYIFRSKWQLSKLEEFPLNTNESVPSNTSLYCCWVDLEPGKDVADIKICIFWNQVQD